MKCFEFDSNFNFNNIFLFKDRSFTHNYRSEPWYTIETEIYIKRYEISIIARSTRTLTTFTNLEIVYYEMQTDDQENFQQ